LLQVQDDTRRYQPCNADTRNKARPSEMVVSPLAEIFVFEFNNLADRYIGNKHRQHEYHQPCDSGVAIRQKRKLVLKSKKSPELLKNFRQEIHSENLTQAPKSNFPVMASMHFNRRLSYYIFLAKRLSLATVRVSDRRFAIRRHLADQPRKATRRETLERLRNQTVAAAGGH
jgi:hypothetical protein